MLKHLCRTCGMMEVNVILVWCEDTKQAALFDPTFGSEEMIAEIEAEKLDLRYIVNTHGHADHIAENGIFRSRFRAPLLIHALDRPMLTDPVKNLSALMGNPIVSPDADGELKDGDELTLGNGTLRALHIPGHSPGSLVFYHPGFLIAGDTLFAGGMGRTDLPGGNEQALLDSIRKKIFTLPQDTVVYPGHGPSTTVGEESRDNPFLID